MTSSLAGRSIAGRDGGPGDRQRARWRALPEWGLAVALMVSAVSAGEARAERVGAMYVLVEGQYAVGGGPPYYSSREAACAAFDALRTDINQGNHVELVGSTYTCYLGGSAYGFTSPTMAVCPVLQTGWVLNGGFCDRADCVLPEVRQADGSCAGPPAPVSADEETIPATATADGEVTVGSSLGWFGSCAAACAVYDEWRTDVNVGHSCGPWNAQEACWLGGSVYGLQRRTAYSCPEGQGWRLVPPLCARRRCADSDVCNGVETNLADGGCQAGTPLVCNDGLTCTQDLCEPATGCVHPEAPDAIAAGTCECRQAATGTAPWSFNGPRKALPAVACPGVEGTAGLEFTLSGLGALTEAGCSNGCKSTNTASGSAEASLSLCTANAVKVTGTATASHGRVHAVECDEATCGQVCSAGYCATNEAGGSLAVAVSDKVAWQQRRPVLAGVSFAVDCGYTKSLTGTVAGSVKDVVSHGASATCTECTTTNLSVSAAGKLAANCKFEATAVGMKSSLGCKGCLSGEVGVAGSVSGTEGACGSSVCTGLRANAKVAFESPRLESGFRWFGVSFVCRGGVTGCSEANSCGTCTCGGAACTEMKADFSCAVCTPGTALSQCAGATAGGTL